MTAGDIDSGVVIADAGPLIALSRIERLSLLHDLFDRVHLTEIVRQEVMDGGRFDDATLIQQAIVDGWLVVEPLSDTHPILTPSGLDAGEISSISWALARREMGAQSLLIIDDASARTVAMHLKLPIVGTAGVIGRAKQAGLIAQAAPLLRRLPEVGYFVAPGIIEAVLRQVGELPQRS